MSRRAGTVASFDEARGLGTITSSEGEELLFHCVEITDGTRAIDVGVPVSFDTSLRLGRLEAVRVTP